MTTNLDFNDAGAQRSFAVIPAHTNCVLQITIHPGGGGDDGWLTDASDQASQGLDCEFTVVEGEYAKRKLWQRFTLEGTKPNHAEAGRISRNTIRAMIESARGIRPDDASDEAKAKRKLAGWGDLNGLRFMARLGVKPPEGNFPAKKHAHGGDHAGADQLEGNRPAAAWCTEWRRRAGQCHCEPACVVATAGECNCAAGLGGLIPWIRFLSGKISGSARRRKPPSLKHGRWRNRVKPGLVTCP